MTQETSAHSLILRGGLSAASGLAIRLGARLIFLVLAAHLFGAVLFGAFSLAVAVVELAAAVAGLGLKRYLFKLLEERGPREQGHILLDALLLVIAASLILAATIAAAAMLLPPTILAPDTARALKWVAPLVAGQALLDVLLAATRWRHLMRYDVVARSFVEPYIGAAAAVAAFFAGFAASGLLIGYAAGTLLAVAYAAIGVKRCFGRLGLADYRPRRRELGAILRATALPTMTDGLAGFLGRIDLLLVGVMLGEAAAGVYAMARQLRTPIRQVRQAVDSLLTPVVARTLAIEGPAATTAAIASATRMILAAALPMVLLLLVLGSPLLGWFGPEFAPAYVALLVLAVAETIQGAFSISDLLLLYLRARLALTVTVAMIAMQLLSAGPLILSFGIEGAALSVLGATCAGALLRRSLLRSRFGVAAPLLHAAGPLAAAVAAGSAALVALSLVSADWPGSSYFAATATALFVYGAAIWLWLSLSGETLRFTGFRTASANS